jgi:DNA phosphorothioation-dependent restriction protein DptH
MSSTGITFQELTSTDLTNALCEVLVPRLRERLRTRAPGHCMRVANLDQALMKALCRSLRKECPSAQIYILENGAPSPEQEQGEALFISSTRLVELRNPLPGGALRPPLLVFLPANLHASAEDSFGIATFEDVTITDVYQELQQLLMERIPHPLQGYLHDLFMILSEAKWLWADDVARVRFLLTAIKNQVDGESLGASLYELGLVPDFHLFDDPPLMRSRIRRNLESLRKITYSDASPRGRVLELGLSDREVQHRLTNFLAEVGVVDPYNWTRQIVINKRNWDLSFDKWKFIEEISRDKVSIEVLPLETIHEVKEEEASDERLEGLSGQRVLDPDKQSKFSVTFCVDPHPTRVPSLDHFTVQILTRNGEPVGGARRVNVHNWGPKKHEHTVHLDKLNRLDFEDGWHMVRVLPWTKDEDLVPLEEPQRDLGMEERARSNESEPFYVLCGGEELIEPPQRAIPHASSLEHAKLFAQFKECSEQRDPRTVQITQVEWVNKSIRQRQHQEVLEVRLSRGGKFHIYVSSHLKMLEQRILASPRSPVNWRWRIDTGMNGSTVPDPDIMEWPLLSRGAVESFLDIRERYCAAVRAAPLGDDSITQAADLYALRDASLEYAEAYRDLLTDLAHKVGQNRGSDQQKAILALRTALAIDTVRIILTDMRGHAQEALLVGPTHPLRALWFTTWAQVAQQWLIATQKGPEEYIIPVRDGLLHTLVPFNIPAILPCTDGRTFIPVDNITPFWSLYAPPAEENARGLLAEMCTVLHLPEPAISGETITAEVLAERISRYLVQHPYTRTLCINVFNPGHATTLAQALLLLQKQEAFASLRYDVRFFVADPAASHIGDALETLLTPNTATSTEVTDAFSTPGSSHLFPKLSLAVHARSAFDETPQRYRAHLSILFDLFPAEEVGAGPVFNTEDCSPVYGLIQDFATIFQDNEEETSWRRQPRHGRVHPLLDGDESVASLADLEQLYSGMIATVATGVAAFEQRPIVALSLTTEQRQLIHYIHDVSDWVVTIDRNIGVEFFDHGSKSDRPDYLIDYTPTFSPGSGHRLIITSRALLELTTTLGAFLAAHDFPAQQATATLILEQLRALSGRVALKLISAPTQQQEAFGLALARLFLLYQGALTDQLILPLDAHLDLFRTVKHASDELGEAVTLQRTDLALFDLNAATRTIRCNLVEVKCRSQVGGPSAYAQLKEEIAAQIMQSEDVLRRHFDPQRRQPDRPDRLLKTRELVTLLEFYLGRSQRYGLLQDTVAAGILRLLSALEDGYMVEFSRSALIFDFEARGLESEYDEGIEFYRIGRDQIEALLTAMSTSEPERQEVSASAAITRLPSAAFLSSASTSSISRSPAKLREEQYWLEVEAGREEFQEDDERDQSRSYAQEGDEARSLVHMDDEQQRAHSLTYEGDEAGNYVQKSDSTHSLAYEGNRAQKGDERDDAFPGVAVQFIAPGLPANPSQNVSPRLIAPTPPIPYDVMLGVQQATPQYGLLGDIAGHKIALDLNQTHTISLFGVQGSGKSYTLGSIIEMACMPIPNINALPGPLATVVFHYSPTQDYKPEFTSMAYPNTDAGQVAQLRERYGADARGLQDIVLLVPVAKLAERQQEYPDLEVLPLTFAASELKAVHWKFLMGAVGSSSMYIRQIHLIMKKLRDRLTLDGLREEVEQAAMSDHLKDLARMRLTFASEYINDSRRLSDIIHPGRLIIVDIRDEFIEKDEALGLFVVLLQIFSEATYQGQTFNKLVVFDEAHKYIESQDLVSGLIEVVREMRHKGTSILVASQDPPSVPISLIELSSQIILHRSNSPAWLKHIQKANSALNNLTPEKMSHLGAGEAYIWSARATDEGFTRGAVKIRCRPRVTRHGGDTKTAIG